MTDLPRASCTRCASSTPISPSTPSPRTTARPSRSETSVGLAAENQYGVSLTLAVGEKFVRECPMLEGTKVSMSDVKDEIILQGNDIEKVSQSAASITDKTRVKDKDIRKFLDGV